MAASNLKSYRHQQHFGHQIKSMDFQQQRLHEGQPSGGLQLGQLISEQATPIELCASNSMIDRFFTAAAQHQQQPVVVITGSSDAQQDLIGNFTVHHRPVQVLGCSSPAMSKSSDSTATNSTSNQLHELAFGQTPSQSGHHHSHDRPHRHQHQHLQDQQQYHLQAQYFNDNELTSLVKYPTNPRSTLSLSLSLYLDDDFLVLSFREQLIRHLSGDCIVVSL